MEPPNLYPVKLYVYDLSKGLARRLSPIMLGEGAGGGREGAGTPGRGREAWTAAPGETRGPEDGGEPEWRRERSGARAPGAPLYRLHVLNPGGRDGGVTPSAAHSAR